MSVLGLCFTIVAHCVSFPPSLCREGQTKKSNFGGNFYSETKRMNLCVREIIWIMKDNESFDSYGSIGIESNLFFILPNLIPIQILIHPPHSI